MNEPRLPALELHLLWGRRHFVSEPQLPVSELQHPVNSSVFRVWASTRRERMAELRYDLQLSVSGLLLLSTFCLARISLFRVKQTQVPYACGA